MDPKSQYLRARAGDRPRFLDPTGIPDHGIPGFIGTRDSPGSGITKIHGILARLPPVAWPRGMIPVAPVAKEKSDPNRILRGTGDRECPHDPSQSSPGFTLESGPSGFPEAARPGRTGAGRHGSSPPWILTPAVMGVPGYRGPGLRVHWPRLTTLPTSRIGGTMIQDHRITAPTKNQGRPQMTERPEWTHVSVGDSPTIIDFIRTTVRRHLQCRHLPGAVLRRICRWYVEWDPLAFAKVKALRRRGADSV